MKTIAQNLGVVQNVGLADRTIRVILGLLMLGGPLYYLIVMDASVSWHAYVALLAIYPLMTGMLGWDPLYLAVNVKSCGVTERNQCGTLPYQVDAAMGHHPHPERDYDHSLTGSHH